MPALDLTVPVSMAADEDSTIKIEPPSDVVITKLFETVAVNTNLEMRHIEMLLERSYELNPAQRVVENFRCHGVQSSRNQVQRPLTSFQQRSQSTTRQQAPNYKPRKGAQDITVQSTVQGGTAASNFMSTRSKATASTSVRDARGASTQANFFAPRATNSS